MTDFVEIKTTTYSSEDARELSRALIDEKLCACAQIYGPVESMYWWKGNIEDSKEYVCIFKTTLDRSEALKERIADIHKYELPEIIVTGIIGGSKEYLGWMKDTK